MLGYLAVAGVRYAERVRLVDAQLHLLVAEQFAVLREGVPYVKRRDGDVDAVLANSSLSEE